MIEAEDDAKQRDRLRSVALALDGRETLVIAETLGRSRAFVQRWVYAYRDGGIDAVRARTAPGRVRFLTSEQEAAFAKRVERGATDLDGVAALRGPQLRQILKKEFGVSYSLNGVYLHLKRLGFSILQPRPKHPKQDVKAAALFKRRAPLL
jgi:transposase